MQTTRNVGQLFLSYASDNRDIAMAIADALEASGLAVWIDRRGISGGEQWAAEITTAIWGASAMAIICSQASIRSRNVRQELQLAWDADRPIIPLMLEQVSFPPEIAYFLQGRQWIDLMSRGPGEWVREIASALQQLGLTREDSQAVERPQLRKLALPAPPTEIIGRSHEVETALSLFRDGARLVTLTGPGGVGKTRLGLAVAERLTADEDLDACFVDLSTIVDPDVAGATIAAAVGVEETGGGSPIDRMIGAIRSRRLLLVLDNFEQVIAAAPMVSSLLTACPSLRVLATSRQPLHIRAEQEMAVAPLTLPDSTRQISIDNWEQNDAIALFVARARAVRPDFSPTSATVPILVEICRRLDGMPLAIELAAARIRMLGPAGLLARLEDRLGFLEAGAVDSPERHRTLRDTIAWSYELLSEPERSVFRRLSVCSGGFTLDVATAMEPGEDSFSVVSSLIEQSLVINDGFGADMPRFGMLETIREFGVEQLVLEGEEVLARGRHADVFTDMAEELFELGEATNSTRGERQVWYSGVIRKWEADLENFRTAWQWHQRMGNHTEVLQIVGAARAFWKVRPFAYEIIPVIQASLAKGGEEVPAAIRIRAGLTLAFLLAWSNRTQEGFEVADWAIALAEEVGDTASAGVSHAILGILWEAEGDCARSASAYRTTVQLLKSNPDHMHYGTALGELGDRALICGEREEGIRLIDTALERNRQRGYGFGIGMTLGQRGHAARLEGDYAAARQYFAESISVARSIGDERLILGALLGFAGISLAEGDASSAARLIGAADAANSTRLGGQTIAYPLHNARIRADACSVLDAREFDRLVAQGRELPLEDAVADAMVPA